MNHIDIHKNHRTVYDVHIKRMHKVRRRYVVVYADYMFSIQPGDKPFLKDLMESYK